MPTLNNPTADERGFTLVEVLVAFVIAMLALGMAYEGISTGLNATRLSMRTQEALSRAQSHLAAVGSGMAVRTTVQQGDDGSGFRWRLRITPLQTASRGEKSPSLTLYLVEVDIAWPDAAVESGLHTVTLTTQRLGSTQGSGS